MACLASRLSQKHTTISRLMTDCDVKMFWERYRNVFSEGKQRLWDGLFFGLQKYYALLKGKLNESLILKSSETNLLIIDRKKVNDEVLCLRKQNEELKHLLAKYAALKMKKPPCAEQRELPIKPASLKSCEQKF